MANVCADLIGAGLHQASLHPVAGGGRTRFSVARKGFLVDLPASFPARRQEGKPTSFKERYWQPAKAEHECSRVVARGSARIGRIGAGVISPIMSGVLARTIGDERPDIQQEQRLEKKSLQRILLSGCGSLLFLLNVDPAQAAKFVPPAETAPLESSDPAPMVDGFTVEDLGGLAILGTILLLVFVVGNFVLPSMMFSETDNDAVPFKRDEEGDFYHDPSFTKDFFREARETQEDIDEVAWSQAPFSKLAHEISKIMPPPMSVVGPPEIRKKVKPGAPSQPIEAGPGVRLSGIVAVPGYGVNNKVEERAQAASTSYPVSGFPESGRSEDSSTGFEDATSVESSSSAQRYTAAAKEGGLERTVKLYRKEKAGAKRSKSHRLKDRHVGFGRARHGGLHLND